MKLYDLPAAFDEVNDLITDDGELNDTAFERLEELEIELTAKIEGCCRVMRNYEARALAFKAEMDRLAHHKTIAENNARRLKEYMKTNLEKIGVKKLDTGLFGVRIQLNPVSVQIEDSVDVEALPDQFKTVTITANKRALIDAAKGGEELPAGCSLFQGTHLRVS